MADSAPPPEADTPAQHPGSFFGELAAALAHYGSTAFALLASPIAATRRALAKPVVGALSATGLAAWALPPVALLALADNAGDVVPAMSNNALNTSLLVRAIVLTAGEAAIVSGLVGLLWHPLVTLMTSMLQGGSDEVTRSNMFVGIASPVVLAGIAGALGIAVPLVSVPFVALVPLALGLASALLVLYAWHLWNRRLGAAEWFNVVLVALALLVTATTVRSAASAVTGGVARVRADLTARSDAEQALARVDQARALLERQAARQAAESAAAAKPSGVRSSYAEYVGRRDAIYRAVGTDRTLLERVDGVLPLYRALQQESDKVEKKYGHKIARAKKKAALERQRDTELYERTVGVVDLLYEKLYAR